MPDNWAARIVMLALAIIPACADSGSSRPAANQAIRNYCRAVDLAGSGLEELQREFNKEHRKINPVRGDPGTAARNIGTVYADQVDNAARNLPLQDEWAVVISNQTDTGSWRAYSAQVERDPRNRASLVSLSSVVGHAQGACDAWRNINRTPKES